MSTPAVDPPAALSANPSKTVVVRFRLPYLPAGKVFLAGSFNGWHPQMSPMTEAEGGRWVKDITLQPGTHEYRLVADGAWRADPGNPQVVPDPFGGLNSVIEVLPPPVARISSSRRSRPERTPAP